MLAEKGYTVIGADICLKLLKLAKKRIEEEKLNFTAVVCDIQNLPFRSFVFDAIFCGFVIHHFKNPNSVFQQLARTMKYEGSIYLAEPNGSNPLTKIKNVFAHQFLPENLWAKRGWATPNERVHMVASYFRMLRTWGFADIEVISAFYDPHNIFRPFAYLAWKILPKPLGGTDVLIRARFSLKS
jgi:ubiquinone/menaquinone biosynthesis C-methylase UbiE